MITTNQERKRLLRVRALIWSGIIATGALLLAAMFWFPGEVSGMRQGYSFCNDFLSTMGKTRAGSWDNSVSCLIFNGTLILGGAILALFWKARATFLTPPEAGTILRGCGSAMSVAIAGIGLTPCDFFPHVHNGMTYVAIAFGVICFSLCLLGSHRRFESVRSKLVWLAILVVAGAAQGFFLLLISEGRISSRPALPLMQKLFVLLLAVWVVWQVFLFGRACQSDPACMIPKEEDPS